MRLIPDDARLEIDRQQPLHARVRSTGFEIEGRIYKRLKGRILEARLGRKLFVEKRLACQSQDSVRGSNDTECITCPFRTSPCQAVLRTVIALSDGRYCSVDLATSSARNLMRLDDELSQTDIPVQARYLILTVTPRKNWGEVRFEVDDPGR